MEQKLVLILKNNDGIVATHTVNNSEWEDVAHLLYRGDHYVYIGGDGAWRAAFAMVEPPKLLPDNSGQPIPFTTPSDFASALAKLKAGRCVARAGWNGTGMHVYLEDMLSHTIPGGVFKGERREYAPALVLYTAQGVHQPGWAPSQADLFADDWYEIIPN